MKELGKLDRSKESRFTCNLICTSHTLSPISLSAASYLPNIVPTYCYMLATLHTRNHRMHMQNVDQCPISVQSQRLRTLKDRDSVFFCFLFSFGHQPSPHTIHPSAQHHHLTHCNFSLGQAPTNGSAFLSIASAVNGDTINI